MARPAAIAALHFLVCAAEAIASDVTVFRDVTILPMTGDGPLAASQVVVQDDKIVRVSTSDAELPPDARVIEGSGKFLMPGLADMHVHYWSNNEGPLYLANSVTTVRNMWGSSTSFVLDARAKSGSDAAPHIYTPGPLMDGPEPIWGEGSIMLTAPAQAVGAVESQRTTGYRAVKLYEGLTPEIFKAAVQAAQQRDMQVFTHTPTGMTVDEVIALGVDSIEHFNNVEDAVFASENDADGASWFAKWAGADDEKMRALAKQSAEMGVAHVPTFAVIAKRYEYGADADAFFARPEAGYVGPGVSGWWMGSASRMGAYDDEKQRAAESQRTFARHLFEADAPLLIGTDTPNPFVLPGFAIHDELAAFVEAGIPVEDVLRIATVEAAKFLREGDEWGVIREGARADLVLLDADPHDDLSVLKSPIGVMVNGNWYAAADLAERLAALHAEIAAESASQSPATQ